MYDGVLECKLIFNSWTDVKNIDHIKNLKQNVNGKVTRFDWFKFEYIRTLDEVMHGKCGAKKATDITKRNISTNV